MKAPALLAALLFTTLPALAQSVTVTNIQVIPLHQGMNVLPQFVPDGRDAQILEAWRDNGNAYGYTSFVVVIAGKSKYERPWGIVGVDKVNDGFQDSVHDFPHTGEDYVRSVRFARGMVDGKPASLLITAERMLTSQPIPDAAPAKISIYKLTASGVGVGTTPFYFSLVRENTSKTPYCNSELALNKELGLPLPADYGGPNVKDGCF